jgi:hypothetical protein
MVSSDAKNDISDLIARINDLRTKQLGGIDLNDEELREGIRLLSMVRTLRAGKTASAEKDEPLNKMFKSDF